MKVLGCYISLASLLTNRTGICMDNNCVLAVWLMLQRFRAAYRCVNISPNESSLAHENILSGSGVLSRDQIANEEPKLVIQFLDLLRDAFERPEFIDGLGF